MSSEKGINQRRHCKIHSTQWIWQMSLNFNYWWQYFRLCLL